ncbi:MAG: YhdP family protein [Pseudomonadota bacterium]
MPNFLKIIARWLAYIGAALIVLLAIAVGLFRLLVPELPEYREEIERRVSEAVGLDVAFASVDARWRLYGPELIGRAVVVTDPTDSSVLLTAEEVVVGASVTQLVWRQQVVINRFALDRVRLDLRRDESGTILLNNRSLADLAQPLFGEPGAAAAAPDSLRFDLTDLELGYRDPGARREASRFVIPQLQVVTRRGSSDVTAEVQLLGQSGAPLSLEANRDGADAPWSLFIQAVDTDFGAYLRTLPASWPVPATGTGSVEWWVNFGGGGEAMSASANVSLNDVAVPLPDDRPPIVVAVTGHAEWEFGDTAMVVGFDIDELTVDDSIWPGTVGELRIGRAPTEELALRINYLRFDDLRAFSDWLPEEWRSRIDSAAPSGDLFDTTVELAGWSSDDLLYAIETRFAQLSWQPIFGLPGVDGVSGQLSMDKVSGRLGLDMAAVTITDPRIFAAPINFDEIAGHVSWHAASQGLTLISNALRFRSGVVDFVSDVELNIPDAGAGAADLDLTSRFSVADINAARSYLPRGVMDEPLQRWFDLALVSGQLENGVLRFDGQLNQFPFRDKSGEFTVQADVVDTTLKFARNWPAAKVQNARVEMNGLQLRSTKNRGEVLGNQANNVRVEIADVSKGLLTLKASSSSRVSDGLALIRESPIRKIFGDSIERISGAGRIDYTIETTYPIKTKNDWTLDAELTAADVSLTVAPLEQQVTNLNGLVRLTRSDLSSEELSGVILGSEVQIELLRGDPEAGLAALAIVDGDLTAEGMRAEIPLPALKLLDGATTYHATIRFPAKDSDQRGLAIFVDSDLNGLAIDAPYPLGQTVDVRRPSHFEVLFPDEGQLRLEGRIDGAGRFAIDATTDDGFKVDSGLITAGQAIPNFGADSGLWIGGQIDTVRLDESLAFVRQLELPPESEPVLRGIRFETDSLFAYGQRIADAKVDVARNASEWLVQLNAPTADGAIFVPVDLDGGDPISLRMRRLHLVEADPDSTDSGDPRDVPPISINADDFRLGEQSYGSLRAEVVPIDAGLSVTTLATEAASFSAQGAGEWLVTEGGEQKTRLAIEVASNDTAQTAAALDLDIGIIAESATASIDVSWDGAPRAEFFDVLDGEFSVRVADGRLDEIDPGAGRVLGLMSVVEIPRRLSLDFRDVFSKGLTFSEITADYRIVNGDAFTCNLSLRAPSADIALIGRASLSRRDYNQTVVVNANVGNTLPAVGAVVGGPQVAAAMLVISRIFKKPLQGLGQAYYQINGSWDDPSIERTTVERFYATSQLADCIQPAQ